MKKSFLFLSIVFAFISFTATAQNRIPLQRTQFADKTLGSEAIPSSYIVERSLDTIMVEGELKIEPATNKILSKIIGRKSANQWQYKANGAISPSFAIVQSGVDKRVVLIFKRTGNQWVSAGTVRNNTHIATLLKKDGSVVMPRKDQYLAVAAN